MPNLSSPFHLFLNPNRIQIQTQFFLWVPVYYRYWAHLFLFSHFHSLSSRSFSASLSPPEASLLLSLLLSAITEQNQNKPIQSQTKTTNPRSIHQDHRNINNHGYQNPNSETQIHCPLKPTSSKPKPRSSNSNRRQEFHRL
jgi:hypothetical protein